MKFATHYFEKLYGNNTGKCSEMKEMVKDLFIKFLKSYNAQYSKPSRVGITSARASQSFASGSGLTSWESDDIDDAVIDNPFSQCSKKVAFSEGSAGLSNELELYLMEKTEKLH